MSSSPVHHPPIHHQRTGALRAGPAGGGDNQSARGHSERTGSTCCTVKSDERVTNKQSSSQAEAATRTMFEASAGSFGSTTRPTGHCRHAAEMTWLGPVSSIDRARAVSTGSTWLHTRLVTQPRNRLIYADDVLAHSNGPSGQGAQVCTRSRARARSRSWVRTSS